MKKLIIYLISLGILFGCTQTLYKFKNPEPTSNQKVEKVIIQKSSNKPKEQNYIEYTNPIISFIGVIGSVLVLLLLSNLIKSRKNKENV